ncbi:hypothetical protein TNCV_4300181 [Trichonephila clavipes]|nr:hypothetical protein TNCV_4300181 [Trichonephila clavipes]
MSLDHVLNSNEDSISILTDSRSSNQDLKNWPKIMDSIGLDIISKLARLRGKVFLYLSLRSLTLLPTSAHLVDSWAISLGQLFGDPYLACDIRMRKGQMDLMRQTSVEGHSMPVALNRPIRAQLMLAVDDSEIFQRCPPHT